MELIMKTYILSLLGVLFAVSVVFSQPVPVKTPNTALYFPQNESATLSVNHGQFWIAGKEYGNFFAQAQIYPDAKNSPNTGSIITSGYGGYHLLQMSITGCHSGQTYIYGAFNYFVDNNSIDHISLYSQALTCNEWHDVAFGYNGQFVNIWVDGIPSQNYVYYNGKRRVNQTYETSLNTGGSNHSGCGCDIRQVRIIEGDFPLDSILTVFNPEHTYINDYLIHSFPYTKRIQADFVADYSRNCDTADFSAGFEGSTHRGKAMRLASISDYNLFGIVGYQYEMDAAKCRDFNQNR
jgi:hypothetical protein